MTGAERWEPAVRFTSFLGDNALDFYRQVVFYLGWATGLTTELVTGLAPDEQEALVDQEKVQVVFTCGLPYVRKADQPSPRLRLIAAPVLVADYYQNRPIYFSDIIVRANSPYQTVSALRGATWAYNEVFSLSGYILFLHYLLNIGETMRFFGKMAQSGSHAISMDWVEQGRADFATVDRVVLDMEFEQHAERIKSFRTLKRLGPCPMPPIAAVTGLKEPVCHWLKEALLTMHRTKAGQVILHQAGVRRFDAVVDRDYDPIRQIIRDLHQANLMPFH